MRRIYRGEICAQCSRPLPERTDGRSGERRCSACIEQALHVVRMDFQHYKGWRVCFFDPQLGHHLARELNFATPAKIYDLVRATYKPEEALEDLERCLSAWARGSINLRLSSMQYGRLLVRGR